MKLVPSKILAIIALVINILTPIGLGIMIILLSFEDPSIHQGTGLFCLALILFFNLIALFLYFIDAIFSFIKYRMKIDPKFNLALSLTVFTEVIVTVALIISINIEILNVILANLLGYLYLAIFILEIITTIRQIIRQNKEKTKCTLST